MLVGLLCLNVLACCVRRGLRIAGSAMHAARESALRDSAALPGTRRLMLPACSGTEDYIERELRQRFGKNVGKSVRNDRIVLYAERGIVARAAFFAAHLSIVAVLAGALLAARGFVWYCDIERGQSIEPLIAVDAAGTRRKLDFGIRCDDFSVARRTKSEEFGTIWCQLSIIENGRVQRSKRIDFSSSLRFGGFDFYQHSSASVRERARIAVTDPTGAETTIIVRNRETFLLPHSDRMLHVVSFKPNALRVRTPASPSFLWIRRDPVLFSASPQERYSLRLMDMDRVPVARLKIIHDPGKYVLWIGTCCGITGFLLMFLFPRRRLRVVCTPERSAYAVTIETDGPLSDRCAEAIAAALLARDGATPGGHE